MTQHQVSLQDRYDLEKSPVLMNGTQALVRLMLTQKYRDMQAGLNTAGYVTYQPFHYIITGILFDAPPATPYTHTRFLCGPHL